MWRPFKNVRTRLTLWYLLVMALILILNALLATSLYYYNLRRNLDHELEESYELLEDLIQFNANGQIVFDADEGPFIRETWFEIWSADGRLLFSSWPNSSKNLPPFAEQALKADGFHFHSLRLFNNNRLRMMMGKVNIDGRWLFIRLLKSENLLWREIYSFVSILLLTLPLILLVAGLGGYFLSKKLLAPIDQMAESARQIGSESLQKRLPVVNPEDELGNLAIAFNELLDRLETAFVRLRQFTADAAHELRTPLTVIRSLGEVSLQENHDSTYYKEVIGSILEENRRLTRLVDSLLFLSQADAQQIKVQKEELPLFVFLEQTIDFVQPLAEEKRQRILLKGHRQIKIKADADLLREALLNILDNAIKYAPPNSSIVVEIKSDGQQVRISVADQGKGIPQKHREKIFGRFYRVDKARSRALGGSGLGLAIALWAVQVQGGAIEVQDNQPSGAIFTIVLPITLL